MCIILANIVPGMCVVRALCDNNYHDPLWVPYVCGLIIVAIVLIFWGILAVAIYLFAE